MPDDLAEDLIHTMNEARAQVQALDAKRREETDTQVQFDSDIQRYRELTTRPHS
jgi:molecular chaperone DnaK (HSP70)